MMTTGRVSERPFPARRVPVSPNPFEACDGRARDERACPGGRTTLSAMWVFAVAAALTAAPALEAQAPGATGEGTKSLSFAIDGSGSSEAGIWYFISDRTNVGLLGTLESTSEERTGPDRSTFTLGIGPRIKWYATPSARVGPYWFGGLSFRHVRRSEDDADDRTSRGLGLDAGFGVDWFPVDQMSIGGWTGLRYTNDRAENDNVTSRLGTATTGLRMHIYF